ncbi:MAG TPA: MmcQ/YjbR family DNA-binding protein [Rhizomicrobium sp.]|jgi:hypothetical protein|nr:MmcQ/YjbR family DNA-binding protein [Rhizomicrobium sp.]
MSLTAAQARKIALSFPGTEERISQGGPEIRTGKEFFVRIGTREPDTLMLKTQTLDERDAMIEAEPDLFFITEHFKSYKGTLVRLRALDAKTLRALLRQRLAALAKPKR